MDEIIVQVARTVACRARLHILSCLARHDEVAPTVLAARLNMQLPVVSAHLRRLSAAGLIQRRRSAAWSYGVARSPYGPETFSGRVATWLFELLRHPPPRHQLTAPNGTANRAMPVDDLQLQATIFAAATAFTHMRRLALLRHLVRGGAYSVEELAGALKMSPAALCRHGAKLVRRGYVVARRAGSGLRYRLTETCQTPIHAELWRFVREEWRKERKQKFQT